MKYINNNFISSEDNTENKTFLYFCGHSSIERYYFISLETESIDHKTISFEIWIYFSSEALLTNNIWRHRLGPELICLGFKENMSWILNNTIFLSMLPFPSLHSYVSHYKRIEKEKLFRINKNTFFVKKTKNYFTLDMIKEPNVFRIKFCFLSSFGTEKYFVWN